MINLLIPLFLISFSSNAGKIADQPLYRVGQKIRVKQDAGTLVSCNNYAEQAECFRIPGCMATWKDCSRFQKHPYAGQRGVVLSILPRTCAHHVGPQYAGIDSCDTYEYRAKFKDREYTVAECDLKK